MRIGTQQQFEFYTSQIQSAQERYFDSQKQVLTGKRFELASESPADAHFVISANALRMRTEQLDKNLRGAKDYLGNTETAFSELNSLVNHAYTLAVNGANSTYDQAARDSMAKEIGEIQNRMVALGNATGANGQYIFAGQIATTKPFVVTAPTLTFNGDDNPVQVEIRPNETMRVNLQGSGTVFQSLYDDLESLKNDLLSGDLSKVGNTDIAAMQKQLKQIGVIRADVGTKLQTIQSLADQNLKRIDDLNQQVSDVQDVDMAEAITKMQSAQTAYTAALQVTSRAQNLSLMDFLR